MQLQAKQLEDIRKQAREEAQSLASISTGFTMPDKPAKGLQKSVAQGSIGAGLSLSAGLSTSTTSSAPNPGGSATYPNPSAPGNLLSPSLGSQANIQPNAANIQTSASMGGSLQTSPPAAGAAVMPSFSGGSAPPSCVKVGPQSARTSLGHGGSASPRTSLGGSHPHPSPLSRSRPGNSSPFQPSLSKPSFAKVGAVGAPGPQRLVSESLSTLGTKSQETVRIEVASTSQLPQHPPVVSPRLSSRPELSSGSKPDIAMIASVASPRVSLRSPIMTPRTVEMHTKTYTYSC